jgi:hypothetical protein
VDEIESCECAEVQTLLLVDLLTDNPLHCGFCRKEVDPARLELTAAETEDVAGWFSVASSLLQALARFWRVRTVRERTTYRS